MQWTSREKNTQSALVAHREWSMYTTWLGREGGGGHCENGSPALAGARIRFVCKPHLPLAVSSACWPLKNTNTKKKTHNPRVLLSPSPPQGPTATPTRLWFPPAARWKSTTAQSATARTRRAHGRSNGRPPAPRTSASRARHWPGLPLAWPCLALVWPPGLAQSGLALPWPWPGPARLGLTWLGLAWLEGSVTLMDQLEREIERERER